MASHRCSTSVGANSDSAHNEARRCGSPGLLRNPSPVYTSPKLRLSVS